MNKDPRKVFAEKIETSISRNEIPEKCKSGSEISSSDFSENETVSLISTLVTNGSSQCTLAKTIIPAPVIEESKFKSEILSDFSDNETISFISTLATNGYRNEIPEKCKSGSEILSSDFSNNETVSSILTLATNSSSKCALAKTIVPAPVIEETDSTEKLESKLESTESEAEVEDLKESIILQTEETEDMLEMIFRAKQKLEFYISIVEKLVKSLQELTNVYSKIRNTYLKNMYRRKLEEFASDLLEKAKNSIKDLEAGCEILQEQEKKLDETFKMLFEFCTSENGNQTVRQLKETADHLAKDMCSNIPKQLWEIRKVSYIEKDMEMLRDLYHRFLSTEGFSIINF